jgi:hypothetical protein
MRWPARPWCAEQAAAGTAAVESGEPIIETLIINVLLVMMALTVVMAMAQRNLFAVIVLAASTASSWPPCWSRWTRSTWR